MDREGHVHEGFSLFFDGKLERIDLKSLTGGKTVMVYGQTEVTRDLMEARAAKRRSHFYEAENVALHDFYSAEPRVTFVKNGETSRTRMRLSSPAATAFTA